MCFMKSFPVFLFPYRSILIPLPALKEVATINSFFFLENASQSRYIFFFPLKNRNGRT